MNYVFRYSFSFIDAVQTSVLDDERVGPKKVRPNPHRCILVIHSKSHTVHINWNGPCPRRIMVDFRLPMTYDSSRTRRAPQGPNLTPFGLCSSCDHSWCRRSSRVSGTCPRLMFCGFFDADRLEVTKMCATPPRHMTSRVRPRVATKSTCWIEHDQSYLTRSYSISVQIRSRRVRWPYIPSSMTQIEQVCWGICPAPLS
jgi:hypothetical protein